MSGIPFQDRGVRNSAVRGNGQGLLRHLFECSKSCRGRRRCGRYVDPDHGDGWRDAIIGLAGNRDLRAAMEAHGRKRAALFSWKCSAQLYLIFLRA
jgi:glycosyltransferase involved in cell wall biosynthesis